MTFLGLFSTAYADTAPATGGGLAAFDFMGFAPIILIGAVMYFLLFRPQQKKMKEHADMIAALRRGDKVITSSGIFGTIHKITNNEEVVLEIAEGVHVRLLKASISQVVAKPEPVDVSSPNPSEAEPKKVVASSAAKEPKKTVKAPATRSKTTTKK
jgi:preprotein translocase subunit YajC